MCGNCLRAMLLPCSPDFDSISYMRLTKISINFACKIDELGAAAKGLSRGKIAGGKLSQWSSWLLSAWALTLLTLYANHLNISRIILTYPKQQCLAIRAPETPPVFCIIFLRQQGIALGAAIYNCLLKLRWQLNPVNFLCRIAEGAEDNNDWKHFAIDNRWSCALKI